MLPAAAVQTGFVQSRCGFPAGAAMPHVGTTLAMGGRMKNVKRRGCLLTAAALVLLPSCSSGDPEEVGASTLAASGVCPVTIDIPQQNQAVGQSIQIAVTQ